MKLKLSNDKDVAILDVMEEVSAQNVSVLRAGIQKLLQSGRNKIIINLSEAQRLDIETIKDIIKLHMAAVELKGDIMLVGQGDLIRQAIKTFSAPPGIKFFEAREAAIAAMSESDTAVAAVDYSAGGDPHGKLKQQVAKLEAENKALKAKVTLAIADELRKLRFENGIFQTQLWALEEHLHVIRKERKKPYAMETVEAKMKILNEALIGFLKTEELLAKD